MPRSVTDRAREIAGAVLRALDADISAVHRLHKLIAALPTWSESQAMAKDAFIDRIKAMARDARQLGINLLISPTADVIARHNPWLAGRSLGDDIGDVSRLVAAYVRGLKRAGNGSTLKHFPGNPVITGLMAPQDAHVPLTMRELQPYLAQFKAGIDAAAIRLDLARSDPLDLGFSGLVITCDLDHRSTLRSHSLDEIVVEALIPGADLLLVSSTALPHIDRLARAVEMAVVDSRLPLARLQAASAALDRASR